MFNYINRDHIIGAVAGVAFFAAAAFMTGCSSECEVEDTADTAVTDTETQDTGTTEPTDPVDTGDTGTDTDPADTGTDTDVTK